ncbi:TIGR00295 family protein [Methanothermococcus sp. Ax23]|uniref:TIGR00295 family protein n=1 Tax=Methanothermococcus sp. Ax23 TaxID=3156486 RepID=UPI003B9ED779
MNNSFLNMLNELPENDIKCVFDNKPGNEKFLSNNSPFNSPEFKKSYALLSKLCEKNVVMHCLAVSVYTYELGLKIKNKGHNINLELAVIGALLHDIGRCKTHGIEHGIEGGKILRKYNFNEELALIAERHIGAGIPKNEAVELGLPPRDYIPLTLEEKLVAHCDNLISGTKRVDIDFVVNKFKKRMNLSHPSITRILNLNYEINKLLI